MAPQGPDHAAAPVPPDGGPADAPVPPDGADDDEDWTDADWARWQDFENFGQMVDLSLSLRRSRSCIPQTSRFSPGTTLGMDAVKT